MRLGLVLLFSCGLCACSVDIPLPGFGAADSTAAADADAARLSPALTAQDWALARVALKTALEAPAGATTKPAAWGNPASGLHGVMARDPDPKAQWLAQGGPTSGEACQYFVAAIEGVSEPVEREGLACRGKSGQWSIREARDRVKS